jgi:hypothetical protein
VRVPYLLRELFRLEPGALQRLEACLRDGQVRGNVRARLRACVHRITAPSPFEAPDRAPLQTL